MLKSLPLITSILLSTFLVACSTPLTSHQNTTSEHRKILVVMTNHSEYPTRSDSTGLWLTELTHFTDIVEGSGYETVFTSPEGSKVNTVS